QTGAAADCAGAPAPLLARCVEAALAFEAVQGGFGLVGTGGGSVFPGNASTFGRRFGSQPRTGWNLQLSGVRLTRPDVTGEGTGLPAEETATIPALLATAGIGLFDGFSPLPTVGGVLAVDGILSGSITFPRGPGFGDNVYGYGIGLRVGLLRESFMLPGVSISTMLRGSSTIRLGDPALAPPVDMAFDVSTISVRGTVGKDFLVVGLLGGVGYDRYRSDAEIGVRDPAAPPGGIYRISPRGFTTGRTVFFGGATMTYLVAQLSAEAGWATGYDDSVGIARGSSPEAYDPTGGTPFLTLTGRLTL
ncbi:MAG: hypothetical protein WDZ89_00895, partial [Gemmatimonadota bacterium]